MVHLLFMMNEVTFKFNVTLVKLSCLTFSHKCSKQDSKNVGLRVFLVVFPHAFDINNSTTY